MNDRNLNLSRYQNFGSFGIGKMATGTERCAIRIPKDEQFTINFEQEVPIKGHYNWVND